MSAKRTPTKSAVKPRYDNSTESGRVANHVLEESRYLTPSVDKIMTAGLHERGQLHAIDAFRAALATPGASMREPSNAVAAGRTVDGTD